MPWESQRAGLSCTKGLRREGKECLAGPRGKLWLRAGSCPVGSDVKPQVTPDLWLKPGEIQTRGRWQKSLLIFPLSSKREHQDVCSELLPEVSQASSRLVARVGPCEDPL